MIIEQLKGDDSDELRNLRMFCILTFFFSFFFWESPSKIKDNKIIKMIKIRITHKIMKILPETSKRHNENVLKSAVSKGDN